MSGREDESSGAEAMKVRVSVHNSCEHLDGLVSGHRTRPAMHVNLHAVGSAERGHRKCGV
jgi:hypothetical protein